MNLDLEQLAVDAFKDRVAHLQAVVISNASGTRKNITVSDAMAGVEQSMDRLFSLRNITRSLVKHPEKPKAK